MMGADIFLVRTQCWPAGRPVRPEPGAELTTVALHAPYVPSVSVLLHRVAVDSAPPLECRPHLPVAFDDEHLLVGPAEVAPAWLSTADVIVRRQTGPGPTAWSLRSVYARFPGCLVAAIINGDGCVVGTPTGWWAQLMPLKEVGARGANEAASVFASVVHAWLVAHRPLAALHTARLQVVVPGGVNPRWRHEVRVVACTPPDVTGSFA